MPGCPLKEPRAQQLPQKLGRFSTPCPKNGSSAQHGLRRRAALRKGHASSNFPRRAVRGHSFGVVPPLRMQVTTNCLRSRFWPTVKLPRSPTELSHPSCLDPGMPFVSRKRQLLVAMNKAMKRRRLQQVDDQPSPGASSLEHSNPWPWRCVRSRVCARRKYRGGPIFGQGAGRSRGVGGAGAGRGIRLWSGGPSKC